MSTNATGRSYRPLADRMRPHRLEQFVGQEHLLAPGKALRRAIEQDHLHSMVFWGPPGTGKTTLAKLIAQYCGAQFLSVSAVLAGVKEIRKSIDKARAHWQEHGAGTVLFVDEAHRFNKSQQDAFLPYVEDGTIFFVGATTENPSFELNNALLSRVRTYVLKPLKKPDIRRIIDWALEDSNRGLGERPVEIDSELRDRLAKAADGDARRALNLLEVAHDLAEESGRERIITREIILEVTAHGTRRFDKSGEVFYDQISALHKSVRGSSPDAALYWLCRMLDGGCDPLYITRRLVRMACEDIGNADPRALELALNAWGSFERLGSPEGELAIAQAVVYLAAAPKSNAVYKAFGRAMEDAQQLGSVDVPLHLRNAPTRLMKDLGYGETYRYPHDEQDGYAAGQSYLPEALHDRRYYFPVSRGLETKIKEKLIRLRERDRSETGGRA